MITSTWRSPSNIALVKYWGKKGPQLPANASVSFTLNNCYTETTIQLFEKTSSEVYDVEVLLDGKLNPEFVPKIVAFFDNIVDSFPWLKDHKISITTSNTFPHSSGIASSASAFSAMAFCLTDIDQKLKGEETEPDRNFVSQIARLGSGSASRSVDGGLMVWGQHPDFAGSHDEYAIRFDGVAPVFKDFQDTILLVHHGSKEVSSTVGHGLIKDHPFAEERFKQAQRNMTSVKEALTSGDIESFIEIVESEALTLHALMMSSNPGFILMKPNTLAIINEIRAFRKQTGTPACFTLDAGANVHLLYPKEAELVVMALIEDKLKRYCQNDAYICDQVGSGPVQIELTDA